MHLLLILLLPLILLGGLLDWYICRAIVKRCAKARLWFRVNLVSAIVLPAALLVLIFWPDYTAHQSLMAALTWGLFVYFSIYVPKLLWVLFDLAAKIPELWGRKRFRPLTLGGLVAAVAVFLFFWCGALIGRYSIDERHVEISRADVPEGFDGFRIVQLSDLHVGSYGSDTAFVSRLVDRVNALNPDLIVFTGDVVNARSAEMEPFVDILGRLHAPYGVYSVLGNHDFGNYYHWDNASQKIENMAEMYHYQDRAHWRLLNNNTDLIECNGDTLALIGVENIGEPAMGSYGDLDAAYDGDLADGRFKILLSHNPYHWLTDIADAPDKNIALTLAGHTHAMQLMLFGWSPAKWRYPAWFGLYRDSDDRMLYVNRGIGTVAFPARMGSATPEITVLTLVRDDDE